VDVVDFLLDPWRSGIGRNALLEVMLLGAFCGAAAVPSGRRTLYSAKASTLSRSDLSSLFLTQSRSSGWICCRKFSRVGKLFRGSNPKIRYISSEQ